jgi:4-carboxymuconolactone decarboxylase
MADMARVPELDPRLLTAEQKPVYDAIASGPRGRVQGPLAIWLRRPQLADKAQALGRYCRYDSSLPKRLSELAILTTARVWGAEFEWWAHKPPAVEAGLSPMVIEAIRIDASPVFEHEDEAVVYEIARVLYRERRMSDALYAKAKTILGEAGLVDLIGVLGYYALISMTINAFEVDIPADAPRAFD